MRFPAYSDIVWPFLQLFFWKCTKEGFTLWEKLSAQAFPLEYAKKNTALSKFTNNANLMNSSTVIQI